MIENLQPLRKKRRTIQTAVVMLFIVLGFYSYWLYSENEITKNTIGFWWSVAMFLVVVIELTGSAITGESTAKGVIIQKESNPVLYQIIRVFDYAVGILCICGIIYYW